MNPTPLSHIVIIIFEIEMKRFKLPLKLLDDNYDETAIKTLRKLQLHIACEKDSENLIPFSEKKINVYFDDYYKLMFNYI